MDRTAVATMQTPWDCRWARLGYRLPGLPEAQQLEGLWVCVRREGVRRTVTDKECAECGFWEATEERES